MTGVELFTIGTTAVTLGDAALAIGAVTGAAGALQSGKAQQQMAEYNAAVAENTAAQERQAAKIEQEAHSERLRKLLSSQRARAGAGGVAVDTGSPLSTAAEDAELGELDRLRIGYGGEVKATRAYSQAALDRLQGRQARTAGYYGAGSTLLTGASRMKLG